MQVSRTLQTAFRGLEVATQLLFASDVTLPRGWSCISPPPLLGGGHFLQRPSAVFYLGNVYCGGEEQAPERLVGCEMTLGMNFLRSWHGTRSTFRSNRFPEYPYINAPRGRRCLCENFLGMSIFPNAESSSQPSKFTCRIYSFIFNIPLKLGC